MLNRLSLNKLSLNRVDLNRIGGRDVGVSGRPYIDPELLSRVKMAISTWGKTNDDPDRAILKDLSGNGNDMRLLNFGFAEGSGYGLYGTDFTTYQTVPASVEVVRTHNKLSATNHGIIGHMIIYKTIEDSSSYPDTPAFKIKVTNLTSELRYFYVSETNTAIRTSIAITSDGVYDLPESKNTLFNGTEPINIGFSTSAGGSVTIEQLPDFEGWLCTDGVDDIIESVKPVSEMLEGSNEITVVSIIHQISLRDISDIPLTNYIRESNIGYVRNELRVSLNKTGIYGYTCFNIQSPISSNSSVINNILGDKEDYRLGTYGKISNAKLSVQGFIDSSGAIIDTSQVAYAGGFIANKVLTTDEINQIIAYFNLDRPGQIIKPQLYCNIKKQGITNDNHAEFNDQLIDFVGGHNIQLNNIGWEGESGIIDGALYLDGISDFGKATGLPVLKDYTVAADYERTRINIGSNGDAAVLSKAESQNNGAFMFNTISNNGEKISYSFGGRNIINTDDTIRRVFYQSKYINNGQYINIVPTFVDSDKLWLGTYRDNDTRFAKLALWSLILFPYSLSEFLLERQLKKYKAGTLYPDMIEFRPVIKSNVPYSSVSYSVNPGRYIAEGSTVTITITLSNASDKLVGVSSNAISDISISGDNGTYEITGNVTKSPQKISIVISSYLTMLGNDTLINNETLIKNE
ncbi:hypothetical protein [Bacteroides faecis]|uniref:hypothetical protein n=1 Tax=Bacteroides faecis TaxID=674529 RepID=UPI001C3FACB5|nr:hypothetical protein [Bacteroides faecis]